MTNQSEEQRVARIEQDVAVINVKLDGLNTTMQGVHSALDKQTEILSKFIAYQQKQDHLNDAHKALAKEFKDTKDQMNTTLGWLKGAFAVGTFCLAMGQGLAVFIIKEKLDILQDHGDRISRMELQIDGNNSKAAK